MDLKQIVDKGMEIGFTRGRVADPSMIKMEEVFRDSCKSNICGKYDTSWMGPPQIGEIADLKKQVETFPEVIILQSEKEVEDSFDLEAMAEGAVEHNKRLRALVEEIHKELPRDRFLPLGVDCCDYCERCAYLETNPVVTRTRPWHLLKLTAWILPLF